MNNKENQTVVLIEEEVKKIIPLTKMEDVIEVVEKGFADYAEGKSTDEVQMPPKPYLKFKKGDQRIMPACSSKLGISGTKLVTVHPGNPEIGLPTVMAHIHLTDPETGIYLANIKAAWLTGMRTGAAGAIAVKYLARKNARTLGVVGAGAQALFQIAAITKVRYIDEIAVCDLIEENIEKLTEKLAEAGIDIKIKKATLEEAAKKDILVTTTTAKAPIIKNEWILPGIHINAIGADAAGKEELDPEILKRAKIVIDNWEQASHSGEINVPLKNMDISQKDVYAELGDVVIGKTAGRETEQEITIFDSTGLAVQDLYTAHLVYRKYKP